MSARTTPSARTTRPARTTRAARAAVVAAATLTASLALTTSAFAHVEVEADKPQALAENVTLTFTSEAENDAAGFTSVRVVLPKGIAPADVSLAEGPKGWKLKATADGYAVSGPKLTAGTDAVHKVTIKQLPDAKELVFKAVETYSDGKVSRWIELPTGGAEPEEPAPVLKLKAAAPGAKPISPSPSEPAPASPSPSSEGSASASPTPSQEATAEDAAAKKQDDGSSSGLLIGGIAAVVLLAGGGAWWFTKRKSA